MKFLAIQNMNFSDINPVEFGYEQCKSGYSFGPYIRDFFLLHFVKSGEGTLYCDNTSYPVKQGQIFIIRPHESTSYVADTTNPWNYIWIGFTGDIVNNYDFFSKRVINYDGNVFNEMTSAEDLLSGREEFLTSKIFQLIAEISSSSTNVDLIDYVKLTKNFVISNYMYDISLIKIAKSIGIDRSYLSKLFKAKTNVTFQEFLLLTRLKKGKDFLKKGYSVKEVSSMCGYNDSCSFSRAYKKHYKIPPKQEKPINTN